MNVKDFFFCYDKKVMMYLKSKGFKFIFCAKHEVTNRKFFLFEKTEKLEQVLSEMS